jgi:predicted RNA-binding protein with RPS1 domain
MELIVKHEQEKKEKRGAGYSNCKLFLYSGSTEIQFSSDFEIEYSRYGDKKRINFQHQFNLLLETGDVIVRHKIINYNFSSPKDKIFRDYSVKKTNDFKLFFDLTENGFIRGEKRSNYWGVKYQRSIDKMIKTIREIVLPKFKNQYFLKKNYTEKPVMNSLFDMIVDFHLDQKNIKSHNNVYSDIQNDYPKKKWLQKNENKFLPAVLDYYGIKSKYLISELNKISDRNIHIHTLNYICKLFGSNYIDYLKKIDWENICFETLPNKKVHELKNDSEKNCLVSVINNWQKQIIRADSFVYTINKLLSTRELLEKKGIELKFNVKNDSQFENLMETWSGIKLHLSRGFKLKYNYPKNFIDEIEQQIKIDDEVFNVKVLKSEEDFRIEGYLMKNCMGKQFPHGSVYTYVSMQNKRKKINLQYKKGKLIQSYGKANTPVIKDFEGAIDILNKKFLNNIDLQWQKEKYDVLTS